jgi:hypothetical protein
VAVTVGCVEPPGRRGRTSGATGAEPRSGRRSRAGVLAPLAAALVLAGALVAALPAQARASAALTLEVSFSATGAIAVTLPDGTTVGTTNGSPTVIPAGYYTVVMTGPGGCTELPLFDLQGPGEQIQSDMNGGEITSSVTNAYFQPNSTYSWRTDNVNPGIVHTFTTSSLVQGTAPSSSTSVGGSQTPGPTAQGIVGSKVSAAPVGTLAGSVSAAGRLTLTSRGRAVSILKPGLYRLEVTDRDPRAGFVLQANGSPPTALTGVGFVGTRTATVTLTAGIWKYYAHPAKAASFLVTG